MADASRNAVTIEASKLALDVERLLNGCLGALPNGGKMGARLSVIFGAIPPVLMGLIAGVLYLGLFCTMPFLLFGKPDLHLAWLSAFGGVYLAFAVATARLASNRALHIVREGIVPQLSPTTIAHVTSALVRLFPLARVTLRATVIALLGTIVAAFAIAHDLHLDEVGQILWWSLGWFGLFFTAARSTDVARFYQEFSKRLGDGPERLYPLSPATSALVLDMAALGRTMLTFWLGISISIIFMIPFLAAADWHGGPLTVALVSKPAGFLFVRLVMPVTIFFSGIFGTSVFLANEAAIRRAVERSIRDTAKTIEIQIGGAIDRGLLLDDRVSAKIDKLALLRAELVASGRYTSFVLSGVSLLIPVIGSVVPIVKLLLGGG